MSRFCDYLFLVSTSSVSFGSLTALYLIYLLLFNFQGPSLAARLSSSLARLEYYIIFFAVCQGVLQKFFEIFYSLFCSRLTRPLYYIIFFCVCQEVFEKFFEVFSLRAFRCSLAHSFNIISYPFDFVKPFLRIFSDLSNQCILLKLK